MRIIIGGTQAEGKSTMAYAIAKILYDHGIEVDIVECKNGDGADVSKTIEKRLDAMSNKGVKVLIETVKIIRR